MKFFSFFDRSLLSGFDSFKIGHISRRLNCVARKFCFSRGNDFEHFDSFPAWLFENVSRMVDAASLPLLCLMILRPLSIKKKKKIVTMYEI